MRIKIHWMRELIGKLGVPYNRISQVRGSPHAPFYDAGLSLAAADSNAFRIQPDLRCPDWRIASLIVLASSGGTFVCIKNDQLTSFASLIDFTSLCRDLR